MTTFWMRLLTVSFASALSLICTAQAEAQSLRDEYKQAAAQLEAVIKSARPGPGVGNYQIAHSGPCDISIVDGAGKRSRISFQHAESLPKLNDEGLILYLDGLPFVFADGNSGYLALRLYGRLRLYCYTGDSRQAVPASAYAVPGSNKTGQTASAFYEAISAELKPRKYEVGPLEGAADSRRFEVRGGGVQFIVLMQGCRADGRCDVINYVMPLGPMDVIDALLMDVTLISRGSPSAIEPIGKQDGKDFYGLRRVHGMNAADPQSLVHAFMPDGLHSFVLVGLQVAASYRALPANSPGARP